jgi:hypothetical protein
LIEKFRSAPLSSKSPLPRKEGLFVERGGKGDFFVEGGRNTPSALFFALPPEAANSPLRGENDHFSYIATYFLATS